MSPKTITCLVGAMAFWAGPAAAEPPSPPSIVVSGEGMVAVAPDLALVTSGVVTRAETADAALKANASAMTKVLAAIREAGVEDRDVGTSGLSVQPVYEQPGSVSSERAPKLTGYEVRNLVSIRSRAIDRFGDLVDAMVQAGSNQIESLSFDVSDRGTKLDEARRAAVADARRKAELYAAASGTKLGPVLSLEEQSEGYDGPVRPFAARAKMMDAAPATPIARGEQELRSRVVVRWGLQP